MICNVIVMWCVISLVSFLQVHLNESRICWMLYTGGDDNEGKHMDCVWYNEATQTWNFSSQTDSEHMGEFFKQKRFWLNLEENAKWRKAARESYNVQGEHLSGLKYFTLQHKKTGLFACPDPVDPHQWIGVRSSHVLMSTKNHTGADLDLAHICNPATGAYVMHFPFDPDLSTQYHTDASTAWVRTDIESTGSSIVPMCTFHFNVPTNSKVVRKYLTISERTLTVEDVPSEEAVWLYKKVSRKNAKVRLPSGAQLITLKHMNSGQYAARDPDAHWEGVRPPTVLMLVPNHSGVNNFEIRQLEYVNYMSHFPDHWDVRCESQSSENTTWQLRNVKTKQLLKEFDFTNLQDKNFKDQKLTVELINTSPRRTCHEQQNISISIYIYINPS